MRMLNATIDGKKKWLSFYCHINIPPVLYIGQLDKSGSVNDGDLEHKNGNIQEFIVIFCSSKLLLFISAVLLY